MTQDTTQKTYLARRDERGSLWQQNWYVVDATDRPLGRLAARIAWILQGKHKPHYTPHVDVGDYVVVINADKVKLTGKKRAQKLYRHYTGYQSGLIEQKYYQLIRKHPTQPIEDAVRRMMPRTSLSRRMFKKLKVYTGAQHPHASHAPQPLQIEDLATVGK